jgi:mRNA interferase RelE/StbE
VSPSPRYEVFIKPSAEREMNALPANVFSRVAKMILTLESDPRRHGCRKLHGADGFRLRVGDYRIIYLINDATRIVEVIAVAHRREVYR